MEACAVAMPQHNRRDWQANSDTETDPDKLLGDRPMTKRLRPDTGSSTATGRRAAALWPNKRAGY